MKVLWAQRNPEFISIGKQVLRIAVLVLKMFAIKDQELIMKFPGTSLLTGVTGYLFSLTVRGTNFKTEVYRTRNPFFNPKWSVNKRQ